MATAVVPRPTRTSRGSRPGFVAVGLLSVAIAGWSLYLYAQGTLAELATTEAPNAGIAANYVGAPGFVQAALYVHIVTGSLALLLGPAQFSRRLRARRPRLHRVTGRAYFAVVGTAAICSLVMAPWNMGGMVGFFGFGTLGVLWLWTGARALKAIRERDFAGHQAWTIRNYALSFAAPTLRLWLGVLIVVQIVASGGTLDPDAAFENAYAAVPFLCWLPNIVVAEWLVRRRGLPSYRVGQAAPAAP
ncbi:MAG: DUF2306 domain-containing protein [Actinomycetales bacterium]|nr:DUF2306 domain-containing protein [Actinomycetales bacterium]